MKSEQTSTLFWHDHTNRPLDQRVLPGIEFFVRQRGVRPDYVWVNPRDAEMDHPQSVDGIPIFITNWTPFGNFAMGLNVDEEGAA